VIKLKKKSDVVSYAEPKSEKSKGFNSKLYGAIATAPYNLESKPFIPF
jgi:hypothetical protein